MAKFEVQINLLIETSKPDIPMTQNDAFMAGSYIQGIIEAETKFWPMTKVSVLEVLEPRKLTK